MQHPEFINNYRITGKLGSGSMGVVYLAQRADGEFTKQVAIKLMRFDQDGSSDARARFQLEKSILGRLDHPNIARLIDAGIDAETSNQYIIMEFVEGLPIDAYVSKNNLTITETLRLFQQVCSGIKFAHQNLVIHRDIKPNNVFVTREGQVKILDFGIAKLIDEESEHSLTATSSSPFTPRYASPEQIVTNNLTTASDVFTLGVLLYELLTKTPLYNLKQSNFDLAKEIREKDPVPPSLKVMEAGDSMTSTIVRTDDTKSSDTNRENVKRRQKLQGELDKIILKALRKEPNQRYSSVDEFSQDIDNYLTSRPVLATNPSALVHFKKFLFRYKLLSLAGILIIGLLAGLIYFLIERSNHFEKVAQQNKAMGDFFEQIFSNLDPRNVDTKDMPISEFFDRVYQQTMQSFPNQPEMRVQILIRAGAIFDSIGQYERAVTLNSKAFELASEALPKETDLIQNALLQEASSLMNFGNFEKAKDKLEAYQTLPSAEDSRLEDTYRLSLANFNIAIGDLNEAQKSIELIDEVALKQNFPDHQLLYYILYGNLLKFSGDYPGAMAKAAQARNLLAVYPEELKNAEYDIQTLISEIGYLGAEYQKGLEAARQAARIAEKSFAGDHQSLAVVYNLIAINSARLGLYREALESMHKTHKTLVEVHGPKHKEVAAALHNIGSISGLLGRHEDERHYISTGLEMRESIIGKDSIHLISPYLGMARIAQKSQQFDQAIKHLEKAKSLIHRDKDNINEHWLNQANLVESSIKSDQANLAEARFIASQVYDFNVKNQGVGNLDTAFSAKNLAQIELKLGKIKEAKKLIHESIKTLLKITSSDHEGYGEYLEVALRVAMVEKDYQESMKIARQILENKELKELNGNIDKAYVVGSLGIAAYHSKDYALAKKNLNLFKTVLSDKINPEIIQILDNLEAR